MVANQSREVCFKAELTSIVGGIRHSVDSEARERVFEALSDLERRALVGGASDGILREIAEARFLTGILREAVRPARTGGLRAVLRARERVRAAPRGEGRRAAEACGQA